MLDLHAPCTTAPTCSRSWWRTSPSAAHRRDRDRRRQARPDDEDPRRHRQGSDPRACRPAGTQRSCRRRPRRAEEVNGNRGPSGPRGDVGSAARWQPASRWRWAAGPARPQGEPGPIGPQGRRVNAEYRETLTLQDPWAWEADRELRRVWCERSPGPRRSPTGPPDRPVPRAILACRPRRAGRDPLDDYWKMSSNW